MKLFLLICFLTALVSVAVISVVGAERVPNWFLPTVVFGVPACALVLVLALGASKRGKNQEERESKALLNIEDNAAKDD